MHLKNTIFTDHIETANNWSKKIRHNFITLALLTSAFLSLFCILLIAISHTPFGEGILHFFNVSDDLLKKIFKGLIYTCIASIATALGTERLLDMHNIKKSLSAQSNSLENINFSIKKLSADHTQIHLSLERMKGCVDLHYPLDEEKISETILSQISPQLVELFQTEIYSNLKFFTAAMTDYRINFSDPDLFAQTYISWLENNPKTTILATSSAEPNYFWTSESEPNTKMEDAIVSFIAGGGKMKRIFYLAKDDLKNTEKISRLNKHKKFGVEVYIKILSSGSITEEKYFVVDTTSPFTFRIYIEKNISMRRFSCKIEERYAREYRNTWINLEKSSSTKRF